MRIIQCTYSKNRLESQKFQAAPIVSRPHEFYDFVPISIPLTSDKATPCRIPYYQKRLPKITKDNTMSELKPSIHDRANGIGYLRPILFRNNTSATAIRE